MTYSRWRMIAYYATLVAIGVASLRAGIPSAAIFGAGYVMCGIAGLAFRWTRQDRQEAWTIIAMAVLSAGQGLALWLGESPDGEAAEILVALRLLAAPLMMIEHAFLLYRRGHHGKALAWR